MSYVLLIYVLCLGGSVFATTVNNRKLFLLVITSYFLKKVYVRCLPLVLTLACLTGDEAFNSGEAILVLRGTKS